MYCRKCGKEIDNDSEFCRYCGAKVIIEKTQTYDKNSIEIIKEGNNSDILIEKCQPSMKWYKAMINFFIPMWIFFGTIVSLERMFYAVKNYYGTWGGYFTDSLDGIPNTFNFIIFLFLTGLLIFAYIEIKKFSEFGYKYIMIFFILTIIYPIIAFLIYLPAYIKADLDYSSILGQSVGQLIGKAIFFIPNIIYFKKRKQLFVENRIHNI